MGYSLEDVKNRKLDGLVEKVEKMGMEKVAREIGVGVPTLKDIIKELLKPGRDPRDELPKPMLLTDVLHLEDLRPGMILTGTVRNVATLVPLWMWECTRTGWFTYPSLATSM